MYYFLTNYLEPIAYTIYLVAVSVRFNAEQPLKLKVLFLFYFIATFLMVVATLLPAGVNNLLFYNLLFLIALFAIGFYAYKTLQSFKKKITVLVLVCSAAIYFVVHDIVLRHAHELDSTGFVLLSMMVVVFSFMYFHQILNHVTETTAFYDFDSWLVSGYLLYYLGSFFIFLCFNYFTHKVAIANRIEDRVQLTILWGVHNVFLFLSAVITLTGSVWTTYRSQSH